MNISIARIGQNKTVGYAARELSRYLKQMDPALWVDLRVYDAYSPEVEKVLWLGLDGSVPQSEEDEIRIDVQEGCGVITGSSERAVLIGAYRFLFELGCRFLRPGADGEVIPKKLLTPETLAAKERIDSFYAQYKDKTGPSWEFLKHHANFTKQYADTLAAYLGDGHTSEERETEKQKLINLCYELEPYNHEGFDPHKFKDIFRRYWDKFCTAE